MTSMEISRLMGVIAQAIAGTWKVNYGHRLMSERVIKEIEKAGFEIKPKKESSNEQQAK